MFQNLLNSMFEIFNFVFDTALLGSLIKNRRYRYKNEHRSARTIRTMDRTRENLDHNIWTTDQKFGPDKFVFFYPIRRTIPLHFRVYNG